MNIVAKKTLVDYYTKHPQAKIALDEWYSKTRKSHWTCFSDVKDTFNSVDSVGNQHYVFNIKGNDFRLIVVIQFKHEFVYIRFVGTHAEYDRIKDASQV
ncbi:MAG: type II toxin-antitoxin system HigB family toxin [Muribaculaceae bacterium]